MCLCSVLSIRFGLISKWNEIQVKRIKEKRQKAQEQWVRKVGTLLTFQTINNVAVDTKLDIFVDISTQINFIPKQRKATNFAQKQEENERDRERERKNHNSINYASVKCCCIESSKWFVNVIPININDMAVCKGSGPFLFSLIFANYIEGNASGIQSTSAHTKL